MEEPMVFCRRCGREIQAQARFCPHCGQEQLAAGQPNPAGRASRFGQNATGQDFRFSEAAPAPMGFGQAVSTCLRKYAEFEGRASRSEYWYFALFCLLLSIAEQLFSLPLALRSLVNLALLLPSLAVTTRRLHDRDHSGWHQLWGLTGIGLLFPLLYWLVLPTQPGANRFGPAPGA